MYQYKKQLPKDYTIDEYITYLNKIINEKRIAKLIQIFDNKTIEYIVLMDWLINTLTTRNITSIITDKK